VSEATKAIVLNAVPLLLLAAAYAALSGAVLPLLFRDRDRAHPLDWGIGLVYPGVSAAAGILGAIVIYDRRPLGGQLWPSFAAALLMLAPAALMLVRWRERAFVIGGIGRAHDAQARASALDRELGVVAEISTAFARARDEIDVCRPLVRRVGELLDVGFVAVAVVSPDGNEATGLYAEAGGERVAWWSEMRVDLRNEPSGIASAVFDGAPVTVFDVASSPLVNPRLATRVGAKSGTWIPMVAEERVTGVLVVASTTEKRAFRNEELALLQAFASEAGLALERLHAAVALADALGREQSVTEVTRRVHAQTDPDDVVRVALEALRRALRVEERDEVAIRAGDAEGVPIEVHGKRVGVLAIARATPLSPGEAFLVETVAHEIGSSLQIAQLLAENRRRLEQQGALLHAAQVVTSELELDAVLQRLVVEVTNLLDAEAADCYLLDAELGVLRCAAVHGLDENIVGFEFAAASGLAGEALRQGSPVIGDDYETLGSTVPHPAYAGFAHAMVAPMTWAGETLGALGVEVRDASRRFGSADRELLEAFASLASLALRNAESFAERSRQARVQRGFYRIAVLLGEPLSLAETYDAAAQAAAEALGGDFAAVLVAAGGRLAVEGGYELPADVQALEPPRALVDAVVGAQVLAAADVGGDDRFGDDWRTAPFASLLAIPVAGEQAGLVVVFFHELRAFAHDDLELAQHLAGAARGALDRARLFESERSARSLQQHLARTGSLLATELDPAAVIEAVVEEAATLLGADAAALATLEEDNLVVTAAVGDGTDAVLGAHAPATGWAGGDVIQSRAPVAHEDVTGHPGLAEADALLASGHRAYLGVPLVGGIDGRLQGVLAVYGRAPRTWRDEEVQALASLAANASVALSNAELYQRVAVEREQSVAILANIAEGVVAVDRDGDVVLWNAAAEEITGVPASEAIGRTPLQVLQRDLESESGGTNRLISIPRGGTEVWLSLSEAVMRDPAGAVAGRIFAFRDISAEHGVEQMKSDFVSTVSVELRTPLTSIYGFAQTLLRGDIEFSDEERQTFLEFIARESERLTEIVDALLNVARLDTGDLAVELSPTEISSIVNEVIAGAELMSMNGQRFVADVPADELAAQADPEKLRQVLDQLVSNAVKYSPPGGVVTLAARRHGETVEVSVSDEGAGIPPGERDRIFSKFYKAGDGQARGTGLGLFIAQGLVREMGGRMWVDSEEGRGSRFAFELPISHR
jgi:PAS domain S-box-containing protein